MKKVLITGAFGYIGGRIAQAIFRDTDYGVILSSSKERPIPVWLPDAEVIQYDVQKDRLLINDDVKAIVHLASINNYKSMADPIKAMDINALGAINAFNDSNVEKFIYLSTIHVYGTPLTGSLVEDRAIAPTHPYALSHAVAEREILKGGGIVLRSANGFGCPAHREVNPKIPLVNALCNEVMSKRTMTLTGNAKLKRNFITLEDMGNAVVHVLKDDFNKQDGLFNLAGDLLLSIEDMACNIANIYSDKYHHKAEIIHADEDYGELPNFYFDGSKFRKTGFRLFGSMEKEISRTLELWAREENPFYDLP